MLATFKSIFCMLLAFFVGFATFPLSFLDCMIDTELSVECGDMTENSVMFNGEELEISIDGEYEFTSDGYLLSTQKVTLNFTDAYVDWFNRYFIVYSTESAVKGKITYKTGVTENSEEFFLEAGDCKTFRSFIDGYLDSVKANDLLSISFEPLQTDSIKIKIAGIATFNSIVEDEEIYISNENYKLGVNLLWGGALSYLEDLNSNVQAVNVNGNIYVDSNAAERYSTRSISNSVNLINCNDTGRLIQQSYYGTGNSDEYEGSYYGENLWNYNPVQGGNQYNESSKIVDLIIEENSIYIKCRPLDWAKSAEYITPSYMEATYSFVGETVAVSCRFVDFSGYSAVYTTQEMPAFYCVEPLNTFVYYNEGTLFVEDSLIFWPDAGYPNFTSDENWAAFIGQFEDSFGIGVLTPGENTFLSGVFSRGNTSSSDPATESPTSYIAVVKNMLFESFNPVEYNFYITTGTTAEMRENFALVK